jgi:hypothetical protein
LVGGLIPGKKPTMPYTYQRVDTASPERREELEAKAPGWGRIATSYPQFAILNSAGHLADWPLIDNEVKAIQVCRGFNTDINEDACNERIWQQRMAGDLDA